MVFDSFLCWKSITSFGAFQPVLVFAGYAAGGLTQPTVTKWITDTGKMPWRSLTQLSENKTYSNKVGWDKRSVPTCCIRILKCSAYPAGFSDGADRLILRLSRYIGAE